MTIFSRITLKVDIKKAGQVIALAEDVWKKRFPAALFDYYFVSQQIKEQYAAEEGFSKIFYISPYYHCLLHALVCMG